MVEYRIGIHKALIGFVVIDIHGMIGGFGGNKLGSSLLDRSKGTDAYGGKNRTAEAGCLAFADGTEGSLRYIGLDLGPQRTGGAAAGNADLAVRIHSDVIEIFFEGKGNRLQNRTDKVSTGV